jgi:hypothetical protein
MQSSDPEPVIIRHGTRTRECPITEMVLMSVHAVLGFDLTTSRNGHIVLIAVTKCLSENKLTFLSVTWNTCRLRMNAPKR